MWIPSGDETGSAIRPHDCIPIPQMFLTASKSETGTSVPFPHRPGEKDKQTGPQTQ